MYTVSCRRVYGFLSCIHFLVVYSVSCRVYGFLSYLRFLVVYTVSCRVFGFLSCIRFLVISTVFFRVYGIHSKKGSLLLFNVSTHKRGALIRGSALVNFLPFFLQRRILGNFFYLQHSNAVYSNDKKFLNRF